ncbi:unnamed protein product [Calypogeia fissa]
MSEVMMKGSSLILPGLGPPVLLVPQQQQAQHLSSGSTSRSTTLSSHFQSCRQVRQHSSSTIRPIPRYQLQHVLRLDNELHDAIFGDKHFPSSFHGDARALKQQGPWPKEKFKAEPNRTPIRIPTRTVDVQAFSRPFYESHRPRGNYPSLVTQLPNAVEPKFPSSNVDQSKTRDFSAPGNLDQSASSSALEVVHPASKLSSNPVPKVGTVSEHRQPRRVEESTSDRRAPSPNYGRPGPRFEPSYMVGKPLPRPANGIPSSIPNPNSGRQIEAGMEPKNFITNQTVRRSPEGGAHLLSNSHASPMAYGKSGTRIEPSYVVVDQARSSQNGAHPAQSNYRIPASRIVGSVIRQVPSAVAKVYTPSYQRVQQEIDAFRDQWRLQKMAAELHRREAAQSTQPSYIRREAEAFAGFEGGRVQRNNVAQLEAPPSPPPTRAGAAKWREAARMIEQNRNSSHKVVSGIQACQQNTNTLKVELERVGDISENLTRSITANEVLEIRGPEPLSREEVGKSAPISEGWVSENFLRQDNITDELPKSGVADDSLGVNLSDQPDKEQQWMNADVLVVNTSTAAEAVLEKLRGQYKDFIHACDTEVAEIDVKKESPVGHGRMICFSIYCGPQTDFGEGKTRLWVDVLDKPEVLEVFKSYFEDPSIRKVWHNYSFDKHILSNHGIKAQGFYADTMHLARLYDSARTVAQGGYSLEGLTGDRHLMGGHWGELKVEAESAGKRSMKHLFGKPNIKKDGKEGKLLVVPPVEELQTQPEWQDKWIHYSSFDTVCTWCLWSSLQEKLKKKQWLIEGKFIQEGKFMYDFYLAYVQPFGELLVQMEAEGMMLDRDHLAKIEEVAIKQQEIAANQFKKWAAKRCPDAIYMNVGSDAQIRQLLFGGKENKNDSSKRLEMERTFNAPNTENYVEEGRKVPKKTRPFILRGLGVDIPVDSYTSGGWPAVGGDALKALAGKVSLDYDMLAEEDPAEELLLEDSGGGSAVLTSTGVEGASEEDLSVYGKAYEAFGGGKEGKEACMAFAALCEVASINTLISNFIQPLQGNDIKGPDGRIHCSLNINTETGRLSARRPSLQNQPALEKDRYKIRQAFVASPGKSLIVADYGQLELRILAHLTNCQSMLKAFSDGGDFHSRTALNMYSHVRHAVDNGDVILEWEPKPGEQKPPVPLLKDVFGAERRKAKMLNFSIAYGKTAMGLSKDWKVSIDEAKATVDLWYSDRQEVLSWQQERIREADRTHHVHTLLGRTRHFPDVKSNNRLVRGHIERAAINTPVQGSAADVAMCAMLEINRNKTLQDLGWKLLLQVHDEVILEGPTESAAEAKDLVVKCMGFPFGGKNNLRVSLAVDAKFAQSWYAAK